MELRRYISIFRHWLWLIILGTILAGASVFVISKLTTPVYRATTTLVINQASSYAPVTDYTSLLTSQQLAKTYVELIKKTPTLTAVIRNLKLEKTPQQLLGMMTVNSVANTTLLNVSVDDENPSTAQAIANEIARVFVDQINATQHERFGSSEENLAQEMKALQDNIASTQKALGEARVANPPNAAEVSRLDSTIVQYQTSYSNLLKSYEDLRAAEARLADSLYVAEPADVPRFPVRPQTTTNTLLAAVVGAMLAVGVVFLIEYLDDTIKSPVDVEGLGVVNIGNVGRIMLKDPTDKLIVAHDPRSPIAEAFRALRTNIQFSSVDHPVRVLLVTSAGPGEGKTTVAANLAAALAQSGQKVALVDADLRRPSIHRITKTSNNLGLTNALLQPASLDGTLVSSEIENLMTMTSGPQPPNPAELLGSERIGQVLEELKRQVDWVILDTPPCLVVTDAAVLARRADGVLLVARVGATRRDALKDSLQLLEQVGVKVVGVVMNQVSARRSSYYYYNNDNRYYYYYSSKTGEKEKRQKTKSNGVPAFFGLNKGGNGSTAVEEKHGSVASAPGQHPE